MESKVIGVWWRLSRYSVAIEPLQVVKVTASYVTFLEKARCFNGPEKLREVRERRDDIFPSFDEAKAEYVGRAAANVEAAKQELHRRRTRLGMIESLQCPEVKEG